MNIGISTSIEKVSIDWSSKKLRLIVTITVVDNDGNDIISSTKKDYVILKNDTLLATKFGLSHITTPLWA